MLTRSRSKQALSQPSSLVAQRESTNPKGILKKTNGRPHGHTQQPEWTGPITRSRARIQCVNGNPSGAEMTSTTGHDFLQECLYRGRSCLDSATCPSLETLSPIDSLYSAQSCMAGPSSMTAAAMAADTVEPSSSFYGDATIQPSYEHPLNTLSLLPRHQRLNVLEAVAKAFPITVPEQEVCNYFDGREPTDLTAELKRYVLEKKIQHRNEFEKNVSVFKSECPWEPKWFTSFLTKFILTTKARPDIYQYIFDVRQREQDSTILKEWKALSWFSRCAFLKVDLPTKSGI